MAGTDLHDFLVDISLGTGAVFSSLKLLGWIAYLPLALMVFFPVGEDGRPEWTWLTFLDFLLVTLAAGLAYFRLVVLSHILAGQPWTVFGYPETVRNLLLAGGLLLRSRVHPAPQARAVYRRVGGVFTAVTIFRVVFPGYFNPIFAVIRPALWLLLGILAIRWENVAGERAEPDGRPFALRHFLNLFAAATLLVVVVLAITTPTSYRRLMYVSVIVCAVIFVLRSSLAELSRHTAETKLRNSLQDYRVLFESAVIPIVIIEPESERIQQANAAACEMYEVAPGSLVGASMKEFTKDFAGGEEQIRDLLATGTCQKFESVHRTREGREINVRMIASVTQYRGQEAILSFIRDVTDRKRAEEALRDSEERFRSLVENATVGIYRTTPQGRIVMANPTLVRMLGYENFDDLAARNLEAEGFEPDYPRRLFRGRMEKDSEVRGLEEVWTRQDGSVIFVRESARAIRSEDGTTLYYDGIVEDITERKRAEEALIRLRQAVDASGEVIFMTDPEGFFTFINPEFTRLYGYIEAEVVGKATPRILKSGVHPPEKYADFWKAILEKRWVRGQLDNTAKNGRLIAVDSSVNPIVDDAGKIAGFLAIQRDITEHKRLEEQFIQAQKMEAVGRLAAGVAHDFNNLLTIINGYSELILVGLPSDNCAKQSLEEIKNAGERAAGLTRQLLAFSRQQVRTPRVLDMNTLVGGSIKMLHRLIGEDIRLVFKPIPGLGMVRADPGHLEQVLMNLAVNSRDAMPTGGELSIEVSNIQVDQAYSSSHYRVPPGAYVVLAISDTGCGMDAETQKRIFEPFFTTKGAGKGTGLGLATVYGIIKQHGGYVWVYSEVGKGTTFKIYLPAVEGPPDAMQTRKAEASGGFETVLLAEDEANLRSLVRRILEAKGYKVLEAQDGMEALRVSRQYQGPIHILLTDLVMPVMNGRELAEQLAKLHPEMKVLYMSGYTDDTVVRHGILEGGVAFLQKPFSPEALARKMREALGAQDASA